MSTNSNSHTEGPWKVVADDDCPDDQASLVVQQSRDHGAIIARLDRRNDGHIGYIRRNWDDAHLIAAAPYMLRMHEEIAALASGYDEEGALGPRDPLTWETIARMALDYARAAIKQATEPQP
jgi:hypothetical protein